MSKAPAGTKHCWNAARLVLAVACILLIAPSDMAAQRKGFVLELGAGVGSVSARGTEGPWSPSQTAVATNFKIGYAPSDRLLIHYGNGASFYRPGEPDEFADFTDDIVFSVSGLSSFGLTYFLKPRAPSFYIGGALGVASELTLWDDGEVEQARGSGIGVNAGFEFARHFLLDADLVMGRPSDDFGKYSTRVLRVTLNWLHY